MNDTPTIAYLCCRNVLMGGDYYRATRAAALLNRNYGWGTAVGQLMATFIDDDDGPLSLVTPEGIVVTPDIFVMRPVAEWRQHWIDQAHANNQLIVADLDDDVWAHPIWDSPEVPPEDYYAEWFPGVDAVLASTRYLAKRIKENGFDGPVYVAPNLYDPFGLNANPVPGHIIGTRLWISGRMEADLVLYDELVRPLLEELDLTFLHVGAADTHRFTDRGWDPKRLIERGTVSIPEFPRALEGLSIGMICMSDHPFNLAKTETHAAELAAMGVPLVAASRHTLYKHVPGRVDPTPEAVRDRVKALLNPIFWRSESAKARAWARGLAVTNEMEHLAAVTRMVEELSSTKLVELMVRNR